MTKKASPLASGFHFPEGPVYAERTGLYVVDIQTGNVSLVNIDDGSVSVVANTGGGPNGAALDYEGDLLICDNKLKAVVRLQSDGRLQTVFDCFDGRPFRGPNDLALLPSGEVFFTDPVGSNDENPIGAVYRGFPGGDPQLFLDGLAFPNGLAFSPDLHVLYLAETEERTVHRCLLNEQGQLKEKDLFVKLIGGVGPDGMCVDAQGNLYVAHFGAGVVHVFDPKGKLLYDIDAGGMRPTNVCFGGPNLDQLFITEAEKGRVMRFAPGTTGCKLPPRA